MWQKKKCNTYIKKCNIYIKRCISLIATSYIPVKKSYLLKDFTGTSYTLVKKSYLCPPPVNVRRIWGAQKAEFGVPKRQNLGCPTPKSMRDSCSDKTLLYQRVEFVGYLFFVVWVIIYAHFRRLRALT